MRISFCCSIWMNVVSYDEKDKPRSLDDYEPCSNPPCGCLGTWSESCYSCSDFSSDKSFRTARIGTRHENGDRVFQTLHRLLSINNVPFNMTFYGKIEQSQCHGHSEF